MSAFILIIAAALMLLVETAGPPMGFFLGAKVELLPLLMVYAGLTAGPRAVVGVGVTAGLLQDALSVGPLGLEIFPLCFVGLTVNALQPYLFRSEPAQHLWLGASATLVSALIALVGLALLGQSPSLSFWILPRLLLMGVTGALLMPVIFWILELAHRLLGALPPKYESQLGTWDARRARRYGPPKETVRQRSYK